VNYAKQAINAKTKNNFAYMVVAASQLKNQQFDDVLKTIKSFNEPLYKSLISPILSAWSYAGLNDEKKALEELSKIKNTDGLEGIYNTQKAYILDYMGKNREALDLYKKIISNKNSEISVRLIEIIINFQIRTGQIKEAQAILKSIDSHPSLAIIINNLLQKIENTTQGTTKPIIETPAIGFAEALLSIASSFHYDEIIDIAHMYTALSIYLSPNYSTAKILMADIFEEREMFKD
jgi:tetratricopeptide (TPR) repeat protein